MYVMNLLTELIKCVFMDLKIDLLVIGAGPAGISVAREAKDLEVLLVDSSTLPRDKPCSGLLVEESTEILDKWGIPRSVFCDPPHLDLHYIDIDNRLDVLQKKALGNTNRQKLDTWLLSLLEKRVQVWENTTVSKIEVDDAARVTVIRNGKKQIIIAKNVVGADGATSTIRRLLGHKPVFRYRTTQHFIKTTKKIVDCQFIYWNKLTDWYLWLLPKDKGILEIGGAFNQNTDDENALKILRKKMHVDGQIIKKRSWLLSQPRERKDIFLGQNHVFLAGEAAGFISPSTGEGISFGLRSGSVLGQALVCEDPLTEYKKLAESLISEVLTKTIKAQALSDPYTRAKLLKSFTDHLH